MKTIRSDKNWLIFLLFFYCSLINPFLERITPGLKYLDELVSVLAVPIYLGELARTKKLYYSRKYGYSKFVVLFLLTGILGNLLFRYQPFMSAALPDAFLCVKFWMAIYTGKHLFRSFSIKRYAARVYFHIRFVTWIYFILFVIDNLSGGIFPAQIRYGLRATQLFYVHPTVFVTCCMLLLALLLSIRDYIQNSTQYFIILFALMCSTLRSKAFGEVFAFLLIVYTVFYKKEKLRIRSLLLIVPAVVAIAWDQIEFYFVTLREGSARAQLLLKSFLIALDHFPFGAGFGTFGSYYSGVIYSPIYRQYNISEVFGLSESMSNFISDSFWPMILGQTGYLGLMFYCLALLSLFYRIQRLSVSNRTIYATALCMGAYLMIESTAASAFVHPTAIPLAIWLGFCIRDV